MQKCNFSNYFKTSVPRSLIMFKLSNYLPHFGDVITELMLFPVSSIIISSGRYWRVIMATEAISCLH